MSMATIQSSRAASPAGGGVRTQSTVEIFKVSKFSKAARMARGEVLKSRPFDFHGRSWRIKVYPTGIDPASRDFVSLFLKCRTEPFRCFAATVTMEILDRTGECTVFDDVTAASSGLTAADGGFSRGYARFAKTRELEATDECIGNDDTVTIRLTLVVGAKSPKPYFFVPRIFANKGNKLLLPAPPSRTSFIPPAASDGTTVGAGEPEVVTTGSQSLVIDCFSQKKKLLAFGECVRSRQFTVGGSNWYIKVYPNGCGSDASRDSVAFVLARGRSAEPDSTAEFTFDVQGLNGVDLGNKPGKVTHTFDSENTEQVGYQRAHADLENALQMMHDDVLVVRCELSVFRGGNPVLAEPPKVTVPPRDQTDFLWLLKTEEGSDITFAVGNTTFRAHSCILAAQSPVLRAELRALREGAGGCAWKYIELDSEVTPEAFEALLHVAYTDHLPDMNHLAPTDERVEALVLAADKYEMERLKLRTEEWVCTFVTVHTVAEFLSMAVRYDCQLLQDACVQFATPDHVWKLVKETDGFNQLRTWCPHIIRYIDSKQRQC